MLSDTSDVAISGTNGAIASLVVAGAGSLLSETGSLNVGETGAGSLLAINGGSVVATNLSLGSAGYGATVSVDAESSIEIGTAGTGVAGAVTVDPANIIFGDGTIAANLVNNSAVYASGATSDNTLEVTGSVTGNGWLYINSGYTTGIGVSGSTVPGGVLQLDGAVGSGESVNLFGGSDGATAPALRLLDPAAFKGTIYNFSSVGDTLELPGQTIAAASINGSALDVTLATGTEFAFSLSNTPASTNLSVSGSDIRVVAAPTDVWTGAAGSNFANAGNWDNGAADRSRFATVASIRWRVIRQRSRFSGSILRHVGSRSCSSGRPERSGFAGVVP